MSGSSRINCIKATIHSDPSKHSADHYTPNLKETLICRYEPSPSGPEALRTASCPASPTPARRPFHGVYPWNLPATTLTLTATMTTLNTNASRPWASAMRRMRRLVICTSETWNVIPSTNAK